MPAQQQAAGAKHRARAKVLGERNAMRENTEPRPIRSPVGLSVLQLVFCADGTVTVLDHESRPLAHGLTFDQYQTLSSVYLAGVAAGASLEREALIFEYTQN